MEPPLRRDHLKGKNLLSEEQNYSFKSLPPWRREAIIKIEKLFPPERLIVHLNISFTEDDC